MNDLIQAIRVKERRAAELLDQLEHSLALESIVPGVFKGGSVKTGFVDPYQKDRKPYLLIGGYENPIACCLWENLPEPLKGHWAGKMLEKNPRRFDVLTAKERLLTYNRRK